MKKGLCHNGLAKKNSAEAGFLLVMKNEKADLFIKRFCQVTRKAVK